MSVFHYIGISINIRGSIIIFQIKVSTAKHLQIIWISYTRFLTLIEGNWFVFSSNSKNTVCEFPNSTLSNCCVETFINKLNSWSAFWTSIFKIFPVFCKKTVNKYVNNSYNMLCTIAMYTYILYLIVYVKTNEKDVTLRVYIYIFDLSTT